MYRSIRFKQELCSMEVSVHSAVQSTQNSTLVCRLFFVFEMKKNGHLTLKYAVNTHVVCFHCFIFVVFNKNYFYSIGNSASRNHFHNKLHRELPTVCDEKKIIKNIE